MQRIAPWRLRSIVRMHVRSWVFLKVSRPALPPEIRTMPAGWEVWFGGRRASVEAT